MTNKVKAELPKISLASEPWVMEKLMDTENRIEKAFHDQTKYLSEQQREANEKIDRNQRWTIGIIVTMTVAIIIAVLFKG